MEVRRLIDLPKRLCEDGENKNIFSVKRSGKWEHFTRKEYAEYSDLISLGLLKLGVKKGDKIASVSNNRPEWNFIDMGIMQIGAAHVPIYSTISREEYSFILKHSEAKVIFVSDEELYEKVKEIVETEKFNLKIFTFDKVEGATHWKELISGTAPENELTKLEEHKNGVKPEDLCAVIYTSGTTGNPKGVMLTHNNIVTNFSDDKHLTVFKPGDKSLSFLPLCHVLEKSGNYLYQYYNVHIHYAEDISTIGDNLKEIRPNCFISVPRLLEKIYDKIIQKAKNLSLPKKIIFFWALNVGLKFSYEKLKNPVYSFKLKIAKKLVFSKWQEALGGNIRWIVTGGAALQQRLEKVFRAAGINLQNGYGLTETSPIVTANRIGPPNFRFGSVGIPMTNVSVKIADDGEILVKGPNVMKGYFKNPELTTEVIDKDGWFHTGDIGHLDKDNFLFITDRKKELFKTSGGKYVAPQVIENKFKESNFIEQIMVVGEGKKYISAIIVPNFEFLKSWCRHKKKEPASNKKMIKNPEIIERFQREIDEFNENFGRIEKIKRFILTDQEWVPDNGFLSPTLKLKRKKLCVHYAKEIENLYKN